MVARAIAQCAWLRLADGRRLNYTESGPGAGPAVIYCHGAIGTPLGRSVDLEAIAYELGVRYIAISRPGIGGSDAAPGRTLLSFAADVEELCDALAIARFSLVGVSAGGPYALACARALGERVERLAVCSSLSPLCVPHRTPGMSRRARVGLAVLARAPGPCGVLGDALLPAIGRRPDMLSRVIAAHAAPAERRRLQGSAERSAASRSFLDAAAGGVRGMIDDYLTYSGPWGFDPSEIEAEVHLWHGARDPLVPVEHALQLAISLRRCRVFFDPEEGHHFFRRRLARILEVLIGLSTDPGSAVATSLKDGRALAQSRHGRR